MERLREVLLAEQAEMLARVLGYARSHGYAQRLSMLEGSYRAAVETLTANILQGSSRTDGIASPRASDEPSRDPVAALGMRFARARLAEGQDPVLFVGMLGFFRRAYHESLVEGGMTPAEQRTYGRQIDRFFDRIEIGYVAELAGMTADKRHEALARHNAELLGEKNRYVEAFAALPVPVMFLDADSRVENINEAAAQLFLPAGRRGMRQRDPAQRSHPPVLRAEIEAFVAGPDIESGFETEIRTAKGLRYYQVRLTKIADIEGAHSGTLAVLTDLTHRRHAEEALRRSQAKYASLFENMLTSFAYLEVVLDERNSPVDLTLRECNEAFARLLGAQRAAVTGRRLSVVVPGITKSAGDWIARLARVAVTGETAAFDAPIEHVGRWFSASAYSSAPGFVTLMLNDISEMKWIQESLSASRDYYLTLFEGFPSLIWRADTEGRHDYFNRSWIDFTGRPLEVQKGEGWLESVHPDDRERRSAVLGRALEKHEPFTVEYRLAHRSGEYRWVLDAGRPFQDLEGQYAGFIGSAQDISERKRQEEQLQHLATHDELTGLTNRRVFEDALARAVAHAKRGHPSSLLFVDVDGFKEVNDVHGHAEGDRALTTIAQTLVSTLRTEDLVSRVGGDEFAVLLQDTLMIDGRRVAERLRAAVDGMTFGSGERRAVTLSIGLADVDGGADWEGALAHADDAMYRSKEAGGNKVTLYMPGHGPVDGDERTGLMLSKLKDALARDGAFIFHFQPVFRVEDGSIEYFEALIRLVDRDQHIIQPRDFVSVAERFGLMPQLSRWVVRQAVLVLRNNPGVSLSVNLSGVDLDQPELLDTVAGLLKDAEVGPHRLGFEMSEAAVVRDLGAAKTWIERARGMGHLFSLDDFGSGFNSFQYLRGLPVDRIKIDGTIVRSLVIDPRQLTLVEAVRSVTQGSGIQTVAECVENEYLLQVVRDVGIDFAQGYHLGRPSPDLMCASSCDWASRFPGGGMRQGGPETDAS